jgi:hypothetical protein
LPNIEPLGSTVLGENSKELSIFLGLSPQKKIPGGSLISAPTLSAFGSDGDALMMEYTRMVHLQGLV